VWQVLIRQTNDEMAVGYYYPATRVVSDIKTDAQGNIFLCGGKGNASNSVEQPYVAKFAPNRQRGKMGSKTSLIASRTIRRRTNWWDLGRSRRWD
jgi:hypothetical protein